MLGAAILLIFLGIFLRHHNYRTIPRHGATFDEFAWTWLGINLIQTGMPKSWSPHAQYSNREHLIYQGAAFWIVYPYLEHPPLFGLIAGASSLVNGATDMYTVTLRTMRPLSLLLGALTLILLAILVNRIYGRNVMLIVLAIASVSPTIVVGSRILQNENFFIPMWLLGLIALHTYIKSNTIRWYMVSLFLALLLPLAKVPWVVAGASYAWILFVHKRYTLFMLMCAMPAVSVGLYALYGHLYDARLFDGLQQLQLARYDLKFSSLYSLITDPLIVDRRYLDGWIYVGFMSIVMLMRNAKKHIFIIIPFFTYLIAYLAAIPDEPLHGWYRFPLYPFLCVSAGVFIYQEFIKPSMASVLWILLSGLSFLSEPYMRQYGFSLPILRVFLIGVVGVLLYLSRECANESRGRGMLMTLFSLSIIGSAIASFVYIDY